MITEDKITEKCWQVCMNTEKELPLQHCFKGNR